MVSAAASLGWVDRILALRRHQPSAKGGSTEHTSTEIWSNQYRKWVMLDPTANMYLEKAGVPLNAWEIRQEWFYNAGKDLVFVIGKDRKRFRKADLPILLRRIAGFGNLDVGTDELDKYGFTAFVPNTDLMDAGEDYGKMFIIKDKLCDGTKWHVRDRAGGPGERAVFSPRPGGGVAGGRRDRAARLAEDDDAEPQGVPHPDRRRRLEALGRGVRLARPPRANRLEARTVNLFGVAGPVTTIEVKVSE